MKQPFCAPAEALRRALDAAAARPHPAVEMIPLDAACGRIAADTLCARMDQPPFDRSPLDGYALHSADTAGTNASSCSLVSSGISPSAVFPDAMVPPVPIIRICFMAASCMYLYFVFYHTQIDFTSRSCAKGKTAGPDRERRFLDDGDQTFSLTFAALPRRSRR